MEYPNTNASWTNLKAETEAEGASHSKIMAIKEFAEKIGLELYVKIGGVEAKADLEFLSSIGIPGVIAPMVESRFGLEKFLDATSSYGFRWRTLTIETISGYTNLIDILDLARDSKIEGITVGRGDFAASLGHKGGENLPNVMHKVSEMVFESNARGFHTMIGGRMEKDSLDAIWSAGIAAKGIETRRVAMTFGKDFDSTSSSLEQAIRTELQLERQILSKSEVTRSQLFERVKNLEKRLSGWG